MMALLLGLSWAVQERQADARLLTTHACVQGASCGLDPHRLTVVDAGVGLAASVTRLGIDTIRLVHHGANHGVARGGVDVLFRVRSSLLLVRAQISHEEYRSVSVSIHAATLGTASAPSRAPPHIS